MNTSENEPKELKYLQWLEHKPIDSQRLADHWEIHNAEVPQ
jgi:hypothetical protein